MAKVESKKAQLIKSVLMLVAGCSCFFVSYAFATDATQGSIGTIASNVTSTFTSLAKLFTAGSFIAGIGFTAAAILKFKAYKDNPTQIPIGTPFALLCVGVALIFLPNVIKSGGATLFGNSASSGGVSGTSKPGGS